MSAGLLLIGASGLAREVIAAGITGVVGILDDDRTRHGSEVDGVPVIGAIGAAADRAEHLLVCLGPSGSRRAVVRRLQRAGVEDERFATFVARSARIGSTSDIGIGAVILDQVVVTANARVGRHTVAMPHVTITHDDVLGDFVTLASGVSLGGGVRIGDGAYLGMNSSVRPGAVIGTDAVIGMGAAVLGDVPPTQTWGGVPARRLGGDA